MYSVLHRGNGHKMFQIAQVCNTDSIDLFAAVSPSIDSRNFMFAGISCLKPKLPDGAKILRGSTYLYSDKIVIACASGELIEVYCNADGQWSLDPIQACYK